MKTKRHRTKTEMTLFVRGLSKETLHLIEGYCGETERDVIFEYVSFFLEEAIKRILNRPIPKGLKTISSRSKYIYDAFQHIKVEIQNQVAESFNRTMRLYDSTKCVKYFCLLSVVPEPINKEPF